MWITEQAKLGNAFLPLLYYLLQNIVIGIKIGTALKGAICLCETVQESNQMP